MRGKGVLFWKERPLWGGSLVIAEAVISWQNGVLATGH